MSIKNIPADGNCLSGAFADQISVHPEQHVEFRQQAINYLEQHEATYKCFIEDDEPFPDYIARLMQDGAWGGQVELAALSNCYKVNVLVHQDDTSWEMQNFPSHFPCVMVTYEDGEHYN
eukprot:Platyproteum_vivax@DN12854_c0_g1_i1.p1